MVLTMQQDQVDLAPAHYSKHNYKLVGMMMKMWVVITMMVELSINQLLLNSETMGVSQTWPCAVIDSISINLNTFHYQAMFSHHQVPPHFNNLMIATNHPY